MRISDILEAKRKAPLLSFNANIIDTCIEYKGKTFFAAFVYGDTDNVKRRLFWEQMVSLIRSREAPGFIIGDFNDIINNAKKEGGPARPQGSFGDLRSFYLEGVIFDLPHSRQRRS